MAILLMEGFDYYPASEVAEGGLFSTWDGGGGASLDTADGRFGGRALRARTPTAWGVTLERPLKSATNTFAFGCAFRHEENVTGSAGIMWEFKNSSGVQIGLGFDANNFLQVYRTNTSEPIGSPHNEVLAPHAWYYIEMEVLIHDTSGTVNVYLNGGSNPIISLSGVDTRGQSDNDQVDRILLRGSMRVNRQTYWDDLYVVSGTRLGDCRVVTLRPTADTADADWVPSTGSDNFAMVDDDQGDVDATFVQGSNVNDTDLYEMSDLPVTPLAIHGVQVSVCGKKSDATTREIRTKLKSGTTVADGASFSLASSYLWTRTIYDLDPDTGTAWGESAVNAVQAGQEIVT